MKKSHQKHAKLERPRLGQFGRNEFALIGTPCGKIQRLARHLIQRCSDRFRLGYIDAKHRKGDPPIPDPKSMLTHGAHLTYTDEILHHRFDSRDTLNPHQQRIRFNSCDGLLVNGNHFKADRQIVIIDPRKRESLSRKLDRLTNVALILLDEGVEDIHDFLKTHLDYLAEIPVMSLSNVDRISGWLKGQLKESIPPVRGLVLAGGKSQRMGHDKGAIEYHGQPQREFMACEMDRLGLDVYLSVRQDQAATIDSKFAKLSDSFLGLGPFGALLTAFRQDPNAAWMVAACDLPLLDAGTLDYLLVNRDPSQLATAFNSPVNDFPEPLIAIWEPRAYPVLLEFLAQGFACPRKVLINSDVHLIDAPNPKALQNINTPEEYDAFLKTLETSSLNKE
ncbi:MAG: NTP transferase domain-containing protein [Bacteroidota bacterium]